MVLIYVFLLTISTANFYLLVFHNGLSGLACRKIRSKFGYYNLYVVICIFYFVHREEKSLN